MLTAKTPNEIEQELQEQLQAEQAIQIEARRKRDYLKLQNMLGHICLQLENASAKALLIGFEDVTDSLEAIRDNVDEINKEIQEEGLI